jgi:hypothetical protein
MLAAAGATSRVAAAVTATSACSARRVCANKNTGGDYRPSLALGQDPGRGRFSRCGRCTSRPRR